MAAKPKCIHGSDCGNYHTEPHPEGGHYAAEYCFSATLNPTGNPNHPSNQNTNKKGK